MDEYLPTCDKAGVLKNILFLKSRKNVCNRCPSSTGAGRGALWIELPPNGATTLRLGH